MRAAFAALVVITLAALAFGWWEACEVSAMKGQRDRALQACDVNE